MEEKGWFLKADTPLVGLDAVCALITLEGGRYLVQLRDDVPEIFYPGHWGLFGGAIEPGEQPMEALYRELREETGLTPDEVTYFTCFDIDLMAFGQKKITRLVYEVPMTDSQVAGLVLGEGSDYGVVTGEETLENGPVVPYDAFALWMHYARDRLARGAPGQRKTR